MNRERIIEYVKKIGDGTNLTVHEGQIHAWLDHEKLEEFANLILNDCYDYIKDEAERLYALNHDDGDLLAEKCYDIIEGLKDHFEDPHPPCRDCDCNTCKKSFDPTEIPDWKFYE